MPIGVRVIDGLFQGKNYKLAFLNNKSKRFQALAVRSGVLRCPNPKPPHRALNTLRRYDVHQRLPCYGHDAQLQCL